MFSRIIYGPPDWLVTKFDSRDRRAIGFWTLVFSIIGSIFWGRYILWLNVISVLALIPNFTSETPVEKEEV